MGGDLGNHRGIFDGGDDRHGAAIVRTVCQLWFVIDACVEAFECGSR